MSFVTNRHLWIFALAGLLGSSCAFDVTGFSPSDASVQSDAAPPDAGGCENLLQRCNGAAIDLCTEGTWAEQSTCEWGCNNSNPPYVNCRQPMWAETVNFDWDLGTGVWVAEMGTTIINTDSGDIETPGGTLLAVSVDYVRRPHWRSDGQPPVAILGFERIMIPNGAVVVVEGESALALVANDTIVIGGTLRALGQADGTPGAGGYPGGFPGGLAGDHGAGPGGGRHGERDVTGAVRSGGGGAGYTARGGDGATVVPVGVTVLGGAGGPIVDAATIDGTLLGGSGGGGSLENLIGDNWAPGGGGGGAVLLVARTAVEIVSTGVINVGGGGGGVAAAGGGGGGGVGGMVLIQSKQCVLQGVVAANGGSGGDVGGGVEGLPGQPSGNPAYVLGSEGGAGGAGLTLEGSPGTTSNDTAGGGGGGAAGFIRIDTVQAAVVTGTVSPAVGTSGLLLRSLLTQ